MLANILDYSGFGCIIGFYVFLMVQIWREHVGYKSRSWLEMTVWFLLLHLIGAALIGSAILVSKNGPLPYEQAHTEKTSEDHSGWIKCARN